MTTSRSESRKKTEGAGRALLKGTPLLPLAGTRVIELAEGFAGPWAAGLLADLGAEVLKIEALDRIDQTRGQVRAKRGIPTYPNKEPGERPWEVNAPYIKGNRNKKDLVLDIACREGYAVLKGLVAISDVVVTNMVTGVPEKLGVDYATLRKIRPDLVMVASCGYGSTGPYASHVAMAGSMDGVSGHTWLRNYEGEEPAQTSYLAHMDIVNATTSAFAVVTALFHRAHTGRGQLIDVSGVEAFMPHIGEAIMDFSLNGRVRQSIGNGSRSTAPHGVYRCAGTDRWIAIAVGSDAEWERLARFIASHPGEGASAQDVSWANDAAYADALSRYQRRRELDQRLEAWTHMWDHYELMRELQKAGVNACAVLDPLEVTRDPHFQARGFWKQADIRFAGPCQVTPDGKYSHAMPPWKMSRTPLGIYNEPPLFGEQNSYAFQELLGLSTAHVERLVEQGLTGDRPINRPI